MANTTTTTEIIDSVTEYAVRFVTDTWTAHSITGTEDEFEAAVIRVFRRKLRSHLAELDAREPGKAALVRRQFLTEYEAGQ